MKKQIKKSIRMQDVRYDVRGPALTEAEKLMAKGEDILLLNTGNPGAFGFTAPDAIFQSLAHYAHEAQAYTPSKGILEAREAIVSLYRARGIDNIGPEDVFTGNGVSEVISMCMQALLSDGDEVLIPMPDYPLWTAATVINGAKAVHYLCDESANWYPDIADLRAKVTGKTRAIVVINPNNPTGALYPREILQQIADVAREHDLIIFSDEIYETLIYDDKRHTSIATLAPDLLVVTMCGLSKSHSLAGFRAGWMCLCGDKTGAEDFIYGLNMLASMRLCSNTLSQFVIMSAVETWNNAEQLVCPGGRLYEQRECIYNAINSIPGLSVARPEAAFYIFPKIDAARFHIHDDEQFVIDFLKEQRILVVNGRGFNWRDPDHFRIVYLPELEQLQTLAGRLGSFLEHYQQR